MKKLNVCVLLLAFFISACAENKTIDGIEYKTKGLFDQDEKDPNIKYELAWGNIVWSVILSETIIMPVYFIGFSIYEPVGKK